VLLLQSLSHRKNAHGFGELATRTNESALWSLPDVVARHPEAAAKRPTDNPSTIKGPPNDDRLKSEAWTIGDRGIAAVFSMRIISPLLLVLCSDDKVDDLCRTERRNDAQACLDAFTQSRGYKGGSAQPLPLTPPRRPALDPHPEEEVARFRGVRPTA
jgi:hypothetical protein